MKHIDFSKLIFAASAALFVFVYGVAVGNYHLFPFSALAFMKDSLLQVVADSSMRTGTRPTEHLFRARHTGNGVTHLDKDRAQPGLTLLSGFFDNGLELRLVQLDGSIVARWPARFHDIMRDTSHIVPADQIPQTDWNTSILGAHLLPDGSLLFNLEAGGLAKMDRCGAVQWTLPRMVHHSIDVAEGGGFWVPDMHIIESGTRRPLLTPPYKEDTVLRVSSTGQVQQEISILDVLFENGLAAQLFANGPDGVTIGRTDIMHLNDVEELKSDMAPQFPMFAAGDLLVSLRNLNLLFVFDPATRKVKWHQTGPWMDQHDPDFQANGRISVFSNNNDVTPTGARLGGSTVIEVDPASGRAMTVYPTRPGQAFYTMYRGQHQRLPNGNLLLSESMAGRVIEVTAQGDIVWELINRYDEQDIASVNDAIRYPDGYLTVTDWSCSK